MCLNHVFECELAFAEIRRTLRKGGQFYGYVPLLARIHPDPHDYWRYTAETLTKVLKKNGFASCQIVAYGRLFSVMFDLASILWKAKILRPLGAFVVLGLDWILSRFIGHKRNTETYVLGYFFRAE